MATPITNKMKDDAKRDIAKLGPYDTSGWISGTGRYKKIYGGYQVQVSRCWDSEDGFNEVILRLRLGLEVTSDYSYQFFLNHKPVTQGQAEKALRLSGEDFDTRIAKLGRSR